MPKKIVNAKIAFLDFSLQKAKMKLGVQVLVEDPEQLESVLAKAADHGEPTLVDVISQPLQEAQAPVSEWVA